MDRCCQIVTEMAIFGVRGRLVIYRHYNSFNPPMSSPSRVNIDIRWSVTRVESNMRDTPTDVNIHS